MIIPAEALRVRLELVFRAQGADKKEARIFAEVLTEAELRGRPTHGLNRVEGLVRWLRGRKPGRPEIVEERGPLVRMDGNDQSGYLVAAAMVEAAVRVAREQGFALVGARNARHAGMLGYYAGRVAEQGVVALMFAHCCPLMAPWGGAESVLGTNPIAAAFPRSPHPILVDLSTAATTQGAVSHARLTGDALPPDSAVDADGRVTTDPNAVHTLLPFGRHKGFALSLMVQLLAGVVTGATGVPDDHTDYGHLLLAIRPDLFGAREHYERETDEVIRRLKACRKMEGHDHILIPGERAYRERERRLREGIEISEDDLEMLDALRQT